VRAFVAGLGLLAPCLAVASACPAPAGLEVATVQSAAVALQQGDKLLQWSPASEPTAARPLRNLLELAALRTELGAWAPINLQVRRGPQLLTLRVASAQVPATVVPVGPAAQSWQTRFAACLAAKQPLQAAWALLAGAPEDDARFAQLLAQLPIPLARARLLAVRADALERSAPAKAAAVWTRLLETLSQGRPQASAANAPAIALARSEALYRRSTLRGRGGDLVTKQSGLEAALALREAAAPVSLAVGETVLALGIGQALQGDLQAARTLFERALQLARAVDPLCPEVAAALGALGNTVQRQGLLRDAHRYYSEMLRINRAQGEQSLQVSFALNNLGYIAELRGDLATAERRYQETVAIREALAPESLHLARALDNLAVVAVLRGEHGRADGLQQRALALYEALDPGPLVLATHHKLMADAAQARGDLALAAERLALASALEGPVASETLSFAGILAGQAAVALEQNDLDAAARFQRAAQKIRRAVAPGSLSVAQGHYLGAQLASQQGDSARAEGLAAQALALQRELAPDTLALAESAYLAAGLLAQRGAVADALERYREAVDAIDGQRGRLGGSDLVRARFAARYGHFYKDYLDLLLRQGARREAFELLERYRARELRALLAERDLQIDAALPAALQQARTALNADLNRVSGALKGLSVNDADRSARRSLVRELRSLRERQAELDRQVRAAAPALAALQAPAPLSLPAAAGQLPRDTLVLSYALGREHSWLFALKRDGDGFALQTWPIAAGYEALQTQVADFRRRVLSRSSELGALQAQARTLFDQLLAPALAWAPDRPRLLLLPDGPLQLLPFSALMPDAVRYLVESFSLHRSQSLALYLDTLARPRSTARADGPRVVAFASDAGDPLPYAEREVRDLGSRFPGASQVLTGRAATESAARALDPGPELVHFAAHGVFDAQFPLNSHIALAASQAPAGQNGLLEAWEIFESLRIDAHLVTLSACDSAAGADGGGEGLIGLTRAFQYAGARAVLAALWPVADRSTSELMDSLYKVLATGARADDALRAAQLNLLRRDQTLLDRITGLWRADYRHPFYWAGFSLQGIPGVLGQSAGVPSGLP
jgi:CHAT domain-containing protein/Tfp pilus assembly protein PilF